MPYPLQKHSEAKGIAERVQALSGCAGMSKKATPVSGFPMEHSVGSAVRLTHRGFAQALQDSLAPYDIPVGMWYFLRVLWEEDGLTQRELSKRSGSMDSTTVEQLKNMENAGYILRRRSTEDRRKIHVYLTPKGRALEAKLLPFAVAVNNRALQGLNDGEIGFLRLVLSRIRANLENSREDMIASVREKRRAKA
jgi:DNA-binding MarR family transcriptional regulator